MRKIYQRKLSLDIDLTFHKKHLSKCTQPHEITQQYMQDVEKSFTTDLGTPQAAEHMCWYMAIKIEAFPAKIMCRWRLYKGVLQSPCS